MIILIKFNLFYKKKLYLGMYQECLLEITFVLSNKNCNKISNKKNYIII